MTAFRRPRSSASFASTTAAPAKTSAPSHATAGGTGAVCGSSMDREASSPKIGYTLSLRFMMGGTTQAGRDLRRAVLAVATANVLYFFVECGVALRIGSVSLFADSIDFLADASLNFLIAVALGWPARRRARLGL